MATSHIQKYKPEDKDAVRKVILAGLKEFGFSYNPILDSGLDDPEEYYIQKGGMFFVLKVDNNIIGTVAIINKGKTAELKRLYVNKQFQGKGFGSLLLDSAIQFCREHTFKKLEFETNKKFEKAHILYERRGFNIIKEDPEHYYMEKEL